MSDPSKIKLEDLVLKIVGSYTRNTVRAPYACIRCAGAKNSGYGTCYDCGFRSNHVFPDAAGFVTYASGGSTAGTGMHTYKQEDPPWQSESMVQLMVTYGLEHLSCAERQVGSPVTHYAFTPSTQGREIALRALVLGYYVSNFQEITIRHNGDPKNRRVVSPELFSSDPIPAGAHVLLIEDTWVSGGNALSAIHALRHAGAEYVTLLCVSRWINFDPTSPPAICEANSLGSYLNTVSSFSMKICPFSGQRCRD